MSIFLLQIHFYLYKGHSAQYSDIVRKFVRKEYLKQICFYYFPTNEVVHTLAKDEVSHILHIRGSKEQNALYGYVELFNMQTFVIIFSMNYDGPEINQTYSYDVIKRINLEKNIKLRLLRHHLANLGVDSRQMGNRLVIRFERLLRIIESNQIALTTTDSL